LWVRVCIGHGFIGELPPSVRGTHRLAGPVHGVPLEFDDETLTLLLLVTTELTDVLLPAVTDWRMHRTVVLFQPSPDCCSVTQAGSLSPGLVDCGAAWACGWAGSAGATGCGAAWT
jgi:hypothetical protein